MAIEQLDNAPRCQHVRLSGRRCKAPAKRGNNYCLFHEAEHETSTKLTFPPVEDAASVQVAADQVLQALRDDTIEFPRASLMLSGLRLMRANLKQLGLEMDMDEASPQRTIRNTKEDDEVEGPSLAEYLVEQLELGNDPKVQKDLAEDRPLSEILIDALQLEPPPGFDAEDTEDAEEESGHREIGSSGEQGGVPPGLEEKGDAA